MQKSSSVPSGLNKNVSFIGNPVSWIFWTLLFLILRIVCAGIGLSSRVSWSVVNWVHGVISFVLFHWIKGSPFVEDHGANSTLTFWEQIDTQAEFSTACNFLIIFPLAIALITMDACEWELALVWINLIPPVVLGIAKLPFMHKVRIFGVND